MVGSSVFLNNHAQQEPTGTTDQALIDPPSFDGWQHLARAADHPRDASDADAARPISKRACPLIWIALGVIVSYPPPPSTIRISASVSPYSSCTSRSIGRSVPDQFPPRESQAGQRCHFTSSF